MGQSLIGIGRNMEKERKWGGEKEREKLWVDQPRLVRAASGAGGRHRIGLAKGWRRRGD